MFQPDKTLHRTLEILDSSKTCALLVTNEMITDTRHRVKFETECTKMWTVRRGDGRAAPFPGSGQAEWRLFLAGPYYLWFLFLSLFEPEIPSFLVVIVARH